MNLKTVIYFILYYGSSFEFNLENKGLTSDSNSTIDIISLQVPYVIFSLQ